jgi:hypothetical protein
VAFYFKKADTLIYTLHLLALKASTTTLDFEERRFSQQNVYYTTILVITYQVVMFLLIAIAIVSTFKKVQLFLSSAFYLLISAVGVLI